VNRDADRAANAGTGGADAGAHAGAGASGSAVASAGAGAGAAGDTPARPSGVFAGGFSEAAIATFRDALLADVKRTKGKLFYNTIVMSARRIDVSDGRVLFVFGQRPATLAATFEQQRASLQEIATAIAGRAMEVAASEERDAAPASQAAAAPGPQDRLKASVMNEPAVQAMLDVFPAEIRDVEEI
jgi:hypothetical protein